LCEPPFDAENHLNFAVLRFKWLYEAKMSAGVMVIIIVFSMIEVQPHINVYLKNAQDIWIKNKCVSICKNVPNVRRGNVLYDWEYYTFIEKEMEDFSEIESRVEKYLHPLIGCDDMINGYITKGV
jgi:hypothetical protein